MPFSSPPSPPPLARSPWIWGLLALVVLALLGGIAWGLQATYQARAQEHRHQIERELLAISQLQARSVGEWRERRLLDAMALSDDALFARAVADWLHTPSTARQTLVRERLRILEERARYSAVYLVDTAGRLLLAPDGPRPGHLPGPEQQALQQALQQAQAVLVEPRRDTIFAFPFLGVVAPLFDGIEPLGAVWLVTDVRTTLYPLLESWPTNSRTAESMLVQRSGDEVLYLSPLRHRSDPPLTVRLSMAQTDNTAVQAVRGGRGILYGRDYRGENVLAVVSAVLDSPWFLVSEVDIAEAFTDVQAREWWALGLPIGLLLLLGGFLTAFWQWNARRRERRLQRELERHLRWLDTAQKAAAVGYFAYDTERKEFFVSPMVSQIFGLHADGRMGLDAWAALLHPQERAHILAVHGQAMAQRSPLRMQYRILRASDQQVRWVQVWAEYEKPSQTERGSVPRMTGTVQDITERKLTEEQLAGYRSALEAQVRTDPLTQVANRRALDEAVASEWSRATRSGAALSLLMVDVDHFKAYNDHYGHVAGDHCLRQVAQALSSAVGRAGEVVARYGGEEFAVLLPHTDLHEALAVAEHMRTAVSALALEHRAAGPGNRHVTVSIGVTCLHPQELMASGAFPEAAEAARALFYQADSALYNAKKAGRDTVMACPATWQPLEPAA
ncbi:MAG: diguanylate cyclase [Burkholderiales bacterium]|nr:diguanylate cyclase [Burkholderiales bacterium]